MKVLLITEGGFIGAALQEGLQQRGLVCIRRGLAELGQEREIRAFFHDQQITCVVNTALMELNVDQALEQLQAGQLLAALNVVQALKLPYLQLSSSYVFDAAEGDRYKTSDVAVPNTPLGQSHRLLESYARKHVDRHIILRTGGLFAKQGDNVLTDILAQFERGGDIDLSQHGHSAPVNVIDLARVVSGLLKQLTCGVEGWGVKVWGDYHYASSDPTTYYHFAESVLAVMTQYADASGVNLLGVDSVDQRWQYPLLNCDKLLNTFGIKQLPWRATLVAAVREYFQEVEHGQ